MFGDPQEDEDSDSTNEVEAVDYSRLKESHLPTGIEDLDKKEPKGLPKGSVVVILGNARTMGNLFLLHAASTGTPTQYITTLRPASLVREEVKRIRNEEFPDLELTDYFSVGDDAPTVVKSRLNRMEEEGYFMIESLDEMNFRDGAFKKSIRNIYKEVRGKKNGIAFLHLQKEYEDLSKDERSLINIADVVFDIKSEPVGSKLEHKLEVHKMRGVPRIPEAVFKLKMGDQMAIDASRDIA